MLPLLLLTGSLPAAPQTHASVNFIRQKLDDGVVWDMQEPRADAFQTEPAPGIREALLQSWEVDTAPATVRMLDEKVIGRYIPTADLRIKTLDPSGKVPRTRVDQPFTVEINLNGLVSGADLPRCATSVVLERHLCANREGQTAPNPAAVNLAGSAYICENGRTCLRFAASALAAADPTKATGEEHFVIRTLANSHFHQSKIAAAAVQVWPIASGAIAGIMPAERITTTVPALKLHLDDLYPRSDTSLMLFQGTQINGIEGTEVSRFPMDSETSESHVIDVSNLDATIRENGTYTLALVTETVFGRELLCDPVTFSVDRPAVQVAANAPPSNPGAP